MGSLKDLIRHRALRQDGFELPDREWPEDPVPWTVSQKKLITDLDDAWKNLVSSGRHSGPSGRYPRPYGPEALGKTTERTGSVEGRNA